MQLRTNDHIGGHGLDLLSKTASAGPVLSAVAVVTDELHCHAALMAHLMTGRPSFTQQLILTITTTTTLEMVATGISLFILMYDC